MKILLADDDPVSRLLVARLVAEGGDEVVQVGDGLAAVARMEEPNPPKIAILDWMMPGMDGVEVCRTLRQQHDASYTYVILVSSRGEKAERLIALDSGVDDFIVKPIDPLELKARLTIGKRLVELQQRLSEAYEQMRFEATHDSLTGLWNRAAIISFLKGALNRGVREQSPVTLILADVDHFKQINDCYGHAAGDHVLREVATRLEASTREYDWVGRYGGEEFVIVATDCDESEARAVAERLRHAVADTPVSIGHSSVAVTLSLGVATSTAGMVPNEDELLLAADEALYDSKRAGRNCARYRSTSRANPAPPSNG